MAIKSYIFLLIFFSITFAGEKTDIPWNGTADLLQNSDPKNNSQSKGDEPQSGDLPDCIETEKEGILHSIISSRFLLAVIARRYVIEAFYHLKCAAAAISNIN